MQPYQKATEEMKRQSQIPLDVAKTAGKAAATVATGYYGGIALSRVLPFLNKYIPESIAIAGLNKLDPRFGKFFKKAMSKGVGFEESRDFIKDKIQPKEQEEEGVGQVPEEGSVISPPLTRRQKVELHHNNYENLKKQEREERIKADELNRIQALKKFNKNKVPLLQQEKERFQNGYGNASSVNQQQIQSQIQPQQGGLNPRLAQAIQAVTQALQG